MVWSWLNYSPVDHGAPQLTSENPISLGELRGRRPFPSPSEPLFFQKSIEVFVPPPIVRTPDALSKVSFSSHAQLFHNPPRSNILGLTGSDDPMQAQRFKTIVEQCHSGFRGIPLALIGAIEDPANLMSLRGKPRMKQHVPDEHIGS